MLGSSEEQRIVAGVIGRPPGVPYDQIYLDRGIRDGVKEGAYVYFGNDQVVGYVNRVFNESALVRLFSSPGFVATVYVLGPDIYTYARGVGGGVIEITVPQGINLAVGNTVILPTLTPAIVGGVHAVDAVSTEPEQRGYVISSVPIQEIRYVTVGDRVVEDISFTDAQQNVEDTVSSLFVIDVPDDILVDTASSSATTTEESSVINGTSSLEI
jgi:cell shape-determining protein MreC